MKDLGSLELNIIVSGGETSKIWALSKSVFKFGSGGRTRMKTCIESSLGGGAEGRENTSRVKPWILLSISYDSITLCVYGMGKNPDSLYYGRLVF